MLKGILGVGRSHLDKEPFEGSDSCASYDFEDDSVARVSE